MEAYKRPAPRDVTMYYPQLTGKQLRVHDTRTPAESMLYTSSAPEAASSTDSVEKLMATRMKPPSPPFLGLNSSKYLSIGTASKMSST